MHNILCTHFYTYFLMYGRFWYYGECICITFQDNLGIESDCTWGVPTLPNESGHLTNPAVTKGTYFDYKNPGVKKSEVSVNVPL